MKYFHRKDLSYVYGILLARKIRETQGSNGTITIIPVPMSFFRRIQRGHNHSETLAYTVHKETSIPLDTTSLSRKNTPHQQVKTKSKKERLQNQKNTFACSIDVEGKDIILIDDVTTTGATLYEARRVLQNAGAKSVIAYTIAH